MYLIYYDIIISWHFTDFKLMVKREGNIRCAYFRLNTLQLFFKTRSTVNYPMKKLDYIYAFMPIAKPGVTDSVPGSKGTLRTGPHKNHIPAIQPFE